MPKLEIELVPESVWGQNLRSLLSKNEWDSLRKMCYRKAGYKCEICGSTGRRHPVECHEVWEYAKGIQKLRGLIALCPACHLVKHFGFAQVNGKAAEALKHLGKVNHWNQRQVQAHVAEAFDLWAARSKRQWKSDISWIDTQIREYSGNSG